MDDISFTVRRGELFGFLGPNGAGKTTKINLLTGLARPDAGAIGIGGVAFIVGGRLAVSSTFLGLFIAVPAKSR